MYKRLLGLILIGITIKLMDDFLDQKLDILREKTNLTIGLGVGTLPYSLVLLIMALYFNFNESISFFLCSYAIGMAYNEKEKLPSKLRSWQESLMVIILSIYFTSFFETITSFILIILLQFLDDYIDFKQDIFIKDNNFFHTTGWIPGIIIILILLLISFKFFLNKSVYFFIAVILDYFIIFCFTFFLNGDYNDN